MYVYVAIFSLMAYVGLSLNVRRNQGAYLAIFGVFLLLFVGTRYETGCDYTGYFLRFNNLYYDFDYREYLNLAEPGFHLLNLLVHQLGLEYMWLNVFSAIIFLTGLVRFSRIAPTPVLMLALMFPIVVVQLGMSGLRQALALSFLLHAVVEFIGGQRIKTALWILIGAQFHQSVILFLPIAWLAGEKFVLRRNLAALAFVGPVAFFVLGDRLDAYTGRYVEQIYGENASGGAVFRYFLVLGPALFFSYHRKVVSIRFSELSSLFRIFEIVIVATGVLGVFSSVALHRMTFYVMPVSLLMLVCTFLSLPGTGVIAKKRLIYPVFVMLVYVTGWFPLSRHASLCYVPYESFLF